MDIMFSQKVWIYTKKNIKYLFRKNKIYQRYISWGFRYNISENSIDIIYKTDDIFMDFELDCLAWYVLLKRRSDIGLHFCQ